MSWFEHYHIGKRDLKKDNHWENLNGVNFRVTKPTVLCFGGNGSVTPQSANYMCRVAQSLVGIKEPKHENEIATTNDVDFIGIAYSERHFLGEEAKSELIKNIFEPLYLGADGTPLSREQILKNFSLINFFAHCHGVEEVSTLLMRVYCKMIESEIDQQTAKDALMQTFSVCYAPIRPLSTPGLQVIPEKDEVIRGGPIFAEISSKFLGKRFHDKSSGKGTVVFKENKNVVTLIVSDMSNFYNDEHAIDFIERDEKWNIAIKRSVAYSDEVSKAMGVALTYSIVNGLENQKSDKLIRKPNSDFMLQRVKSILRQSENVMFAREIEKIRQERNSGVER